MIATLRRAAVAQGAPGERLWLHAPEARCSPPRSAQQFLLKWRPWAAGLEQFGLDWIPAARPLPAAVPPSWTAVSPAIWLPPAEHRSHQPDHRTRAGGRYPHHRRVRQRRQFDDPAVQCRRGLRAGRFRRPGVAGDGFRIRVTEKAAGAGSLWYGVAGQRPALHKEKAGFRRPFRDQVMSTRLSIFTSGLTSAS